VPTVNLNMASRTRSSSLASDYSGDAEESGVDSDFAPSSMPSRTLSNLRSPEKQTCLLALQSCMTFLMGNHSWSDKQLQGLIEGCICAVRNHGTHLDVWTLVVGALRAADGSDPALFSRMEAAAPLSLALPVSAEHASESRPADSGVDLRWLLFCTLLDGLWEHLVSLSLPAAVEAAAMAAAAADAAALASAVSTTDGAGNPHISAAAQRALQSEEQQRASATAFVAAANARNHARDPASAGLATLQVRRL
jgi:hypothetical protein